MACGRTCRLTFEHFPPRSAFNSSSRRGVDALWALQNPLDEFPRSGWTALQRGVGSYSTCAECNSFSGKAYVPKYSAFAHGIVSALSGCHDRIGSTSRVQLRAKDVFPGAIVRQALYMLMVVNDRSSFGDRYPELRDIVLMGSTRDLPVGMRLYVSVVVSGRIRSMPLQVQVDLATGVNSALIELAAAPVAWLLEIGSPIGKRGFDASDWTRISPSHQSDVEIDTLIGSAVNAVPGDYRHPWEFEG